MELRHILFAFACLSYVSIGESALAAVYSLQRHGARNVLPKGIFLTENDLIGGPTLLPQGQFQAYSAGDGFRRRYLDPTTCNTTCLSGTSNGTKYGVANQPGVGFGNFDVYVRSSSLDRAVMSGQCFFSGVFPPVNVPTNTSYLPTGVQVVPIYTQPDAEDILIRAYTKCPAYQAALEGWFRSPEFVDKVGATTALRAGVAAKMPSLDTSLQNWWNVYDAINVYQTYGVGDPVPYFDKTEFSDIQALAYWLETSKSRFNLTRNLLGGPVLADLVGYFRGAAAAVRNGSQVYYRLLSLSGHYNTQLAVLSALELDTFPAASNFTWFSNIPKLAAVMAFELHVTATAPNTPALPGQPPLPVWYSFYVRLVAQDGYSANYTNIPLPCGSDDATSAVGVGACLLEDFESYALARTIDSDVAWCNACNNTVVPACQLARVQTQLDDAEAKLDANPGSGSGSGSGCTASGGSATEAWKIAVSVVITFIGTVLLGAVGVWVWARRQGAGGYGGGGGGGGRRGSGDEGGKALEMELVNPQYQYATGRSI